MTYPAYITSPSDVTLGEIVTKIVEAFDTDPEVRYDFMSVAFGGPPYPLDREEVAELPDRLIDIRACVLPREIVAGWLQMIELIRDLIEDRTSSRIITLEEEELRCKYGLAAENWYQSPDVRDKVLELREALIEILYWFNFQYIAYTLGTTEGLEFKCCRGMQRHDLATQSHLLEVMAFNRGVGLFNGKRLAGARQALENADGLERLKSLFLFDEEQVRLLGLERMNVEIPVEAFLPDETPTKDEGPTNWVVLSGIFVPRT